MFENTNVSCQEKSGAKLSPNHRGETEMNHTPRRMNACTDNQSNEWSWQCEQDPPLASHCNLTSKTLYRMK